MKSRVQSSEYRVQLREDEERGTLKGEGGEAILTTVNRLQTTDYGGERREERGEAMLTTDYGQRTTVKLR